MKTKYLVISLSENCVAAFSNIRDAIGEAEYRVKNFNWRNDTKVVRIDAATEVWNCRKGKAKRHG